MTAGLVCKCMLSACCARMKWALRPSGAPPTVDVVPAASSPGVGAMRPAPEEAEIRHRGRPSRSGEGNDPVPCGPPPPPVRLMRTVSVQSHVRYTWLTSHPRFMPWEGAPQSPGYFSAARGPHVAGSW